MNLVTMLAERAARHPDRMALVETRGNRDTALRFGELADQVARGAAGLRALGLRRGQTMLVFQPVSIKLYVILLAAFHAGLRVMLADPSAGKKFLGDCCGRLPPDAFCGPVKAQLLRLLVPGLRRIPLAMCTGGWFPGTRGWPDGVATAGAFAPADVPDDEPALITFTSGSTGVPKAAVRTHGFLLAQHEVLSRSLDFADGEVDLVTLPVFVLANLASGMTSVLAATNLARPGFPDAVAVRAQCQRLAVTRCAASPAFFDALEQSAVGLPPLQKVFTGGAPVFPDLLDRLRAALPVATIHSVYGSTEAEPMAHFDASGPDAGTAAEVTRQGGGICAGRPVEEISVKILRDHWGEPLGPLDAAAIDALAAAPGQAGEIVVTGRHVLAGYLGGVGDRETKISVDGQVWHRTGDAGWLDDSGRLWLLGRCAARLPAFPAGPGLPADALRYPIAIEAAMRATFPGLRSAAIDWHGRRVLVVEAGAIHMPRAELAARAAALGMAEVLEVEAIPMDRRHNAKIDYPALRRVLSALPQSSPPQSSPDARPPR